MKNDFFYNSYLVTRLFLKHMGVSFKEAGHKILPEHWLILTLLSDGKPLNQQYIANRTVKDKATITRAIDQLIERKLISRKQNPKDRRANLISLLPAGKKELETLMKVFQKMEKGILDELSVEERKTTIALFKRLIKEME
ncbi:MarR family transcriptional regulator [candidate division KSB1 bacterium]|nr:MarR family transcriptional regulator [candidate division KSB1 bacterium]